MLKESPHKGAEYGAPPYSDELFALRAENKRLAAENAALIRAIKEYCDATIHVDEMFICQLCKSRDDGFSDGPCSDCEYPGNGGTDAFRFDATRFAEEDGE